MCVRDSLYLDITAWLFFFFYLRIFSEEEIAKIRTIRLWDVIVNATSIKPGEVQYLRRRRRTTHPKFEFFPPLNRLRRSKETCSSGTRGTHALSPLS